MMNSILTSLPTYYMSTLNLSIWVIKHIDKYRRNCLWRDSDLNSNKMPLTSWKMAQRPKMKGWFRYLRTQYVALFIQHLHIFYNKEHTP